MHVRLETSIPSWPTWVIGDKPWTSCSETKWLVVNIYVHLKLMIKRKIQWDSLKYSLWTWVLKVTFFIHFYPATVNVRDTSCFLLCPNVYPKLIYKRAYIIVRSSFFFQWILHSDINKRASPRFCSVKGSQPYF